MSRPPRTAAPATDPASLWRGLDDDDPVGPMWRAAQIFRLVSFVYALGFEVAVNGDLERPALTWILFAVLSAANVWWTVGYLIGFGRRWWFVLIEVVVSAAMMLSTEFVASADWIADNQTWPTTLWMTNAALSAALLGGARWGFAAAAAIGLTNYYVKGEFLLNFGRNATAILLAAASIALGMAASRARLVHARLAAAIELAAASAERDRLAREVHDGVLQVLALIARRGREIGGPTEELATLAAEQERVLRQLIAAAPPPMPDAGTRIDLGPGLRALASGRIRVSAPAEPVMVDAAVAVEILAAVGNILDNVERHAGAGAETFVLLEDLDGEVVVSVRDDGVGIEPGRLSEAIDEGRLGIAQSIIGRVESLGGRAQLESAPGAGTEWELTVPSAKREAPPR
ncbi:MacS family sensor histidine kinase [Gordonia neofelifaecis]|uniref:ATP-binding region ATPase domain-containing protein n=1 Tax=Gordonia neofelifaecis NRRL B-59395 TaxID=644548 RepID=F1YJQ1_9ACTN|nr:DUF5931 domain-containing protein [Gordonia neofelifaecis]EGD54983.1 ATP-binding region ATPase domain-containing protein [Gordonia neofelifaecis NRRL B-59395]